MPKAATLALRWDPHDQSYTLYEQGRILAARVSDTTPAWRAGLASWASFAFEGHSGLLSLLKEPRQGGQGYWYAYRRQGRRTAKRYVGRAAALTITGLETIAADLGLNPSQVTADPPQAAPAPLAQLLAPKLQLPRAHAQLLARDQLYARLDQARTGRLTLVCAPAGFGKTSLVASWLRQLELRIENVELPTKPPLESHSQCLMLNAQFRVAWISFDAGDNDPLRFWRYLIAACRPLLADDGRAAAAQLAAAPLSPPNPLLLDLALTALLNALSVGARGGVLVLDDYHLITESQIHAGMAFLITHLPPLMHLVIIARGQVSLPLARLRASGDVTEIGPADLRFSPEETARFLERPDEPPITPSAIAQIDAQLAGWPTGLRLLTLALRGHSTPQAISQALDGFAGSHRLILDYFVSEVLEVQPAPIQLFLLHTSGLGRLCASLCDSLRGDQDSAAILGELERGGLFVEPLDDTGTWYRYHALFAEAMQAEARRQLSPAIIRQLAAQASAWYAARGLLADAVEAALRAEDAALAAERIEQVIGVAGSGFGAIHAGTLTEFHTLRRWIEQLPEAQQQRPRIALSYATALLFAFLIDQIPTPASVAARIERSLQAAEAGFAANDDALGRGQVYAFRAVLARQHGEIDAAVTWADRSIILLPADDFAARSISLGTIGIGAMIAGQLGRARAAFREARVLCEQIGNRWWTRANIALLSAVQFAQGELHAAEAQFRLLLAEARQEGDRDDIAHMQACLAQIAYEHDELAPAAQAAGEAYALGEQLANDEICAMATLTLARALHAQGHADTALQLLHAMLARLDPDSSRLHGRIACELRAALARLQLAAGDLMAAQRWEQGRRQDNVQSPTLRDREARLVARLWLSRGAGAQAMAILAPLLESARQDGRQTDALEIALLTALALDASGNRDAARQSIAAVLADAAGEGYRRLFLDEGAAAADLIRAALPSLTSQPVRRYAQSLLLPFVGQSPAPLELPRQPLSQQERRVLALLAEGRSNPEIASTLIVSVHTVRSQVRSIYRKLGVHTRAAATALALQAERV